MYILTLQYLKIFILLVFLMTACNAQKTPTFPNPTATLPTFTTRESPTFSNQSSPETPAIILSPPVPPEPMPQDIIGGSNVQDGPFTFFLWLFRDPTMNQQPAATSLYSDMNGIGAYMFWTYQDENSIGPVETYWGTLPHLEQLLQGTYTVISNGSSGGRMGGIMLPGGPYIPGESEKGDKIQVALKVMTPDSEYGAVLIFTLYQGSSGFEPTNISVEALQ